MLTQYSNLADRGRLVLQPVHVAITLHHWFVRRFATQSSHAFQKPRTVQPWAIRNVPRDAPALGSHRHQRIRTGARIVGWLFFFLMIRRPPRSTLFPTRRSSD